MILLPDADGVVGSNWITVGETGYYNCLDDDNDGTSYVKCNDNLATMIIQYDNPSVAQAGIASIESVRFISSGKAVHRTNPSLVDIEFQAPTSGQFSESCSYNAHRTSFETINGTARTTHDGIHAWSYANLQNLEMKCIKSGTIEVYLSYLALEVTYTELVTAADNSTFFGANF